MPGELYNLFTRDWPKIVVNKETLEINKVSSTTMFGDGQHSKPTITTKHICIHSCSVSLSLFQEPTILAVRDCSYWLFMQLLQTTKNIPVRAFGTTLFFSHS